HPSFGAGGGGAGDRRRYAAIWGGGGIVRQPDGVLKRFAFSLRHQVVVKRAQRLNVMCVSRKPVIEVFRETLQASGSRGRKPSNGGSLIRDAMSRSHQRLVSRRAIWL